MIQNSPLNVTVLDKRHWLQKQRAVVRLGLNFFELLASDTEKCC